MSLRTGSRRGAAFARRQKQYRIESDSEEEIDDDVTEAESSSFQFGGILASVDNNRKNVRSQRKKILGRDTGKGALMTSPPLKKTVRERNEDVVDENGRTPPPKSVIMKRSTMKSISPLTAQKTKTRGEGRNRNKVAMDISVDESTRDDSFEESDADEDDETQHQSLSSSEEKSESSPSRSEDEDSFEESESTSEFEFGVDDEEFVPDEDDEEDDDDDESASMGDFIVDDASEDMWKGRISKDPSPSKTNDTGDDCDTTTAELSTQAKQNMRREKVTVAKRDCNTGVSFDDEDALEGEEEDTFADSITAADETAHYDHSDDDTEEDDDVDVEETPAKTILPRKALDFSSPEPQMALIIDEDDDLENEDDVLVATIVDADGDTVDENTVVLTFDDEEQSVEETDVQREQQQSTEQSPTFLQKTSSSIVDKDETAQGLERVEPSSLSNRGGARHIEIKTQRSQPSESNSESSQNSSKTTSTISDKHYRQEGAVKRGKWALGAKIGVGSFGQVHVGMNTQTGVLMAVKKFRMEGAVMKDIRTEVELMRSLSHVNIVRYLGAQMDKEFLHIFQEWVPGGSVAGLLSKFGSFSIEVIQSYVSQTLNGLRYLHDNNIMHRDIKGSNILVNDEGVVKLADFGASKKLKNLAADMMMSLTVRGTPYFMAPEVFEERYSGKADIWGIGCVAFQMATAQPPWKEMGFTNPISLFNHIKRQKGAPPMEHPHKDAFSKGEQVSWSLFENFVLRCFEYEPSQRPSAIELADDPFFFTSVEGDADGDESTHYRGIFSPENESKKLFSPKQPSSPAKQLSAARCSVKTTYEAPRGSTLFMSPPLPKQKSERKNSPFRKDATPPTKPAAQKSPSPDTREWPAWARNELEKQSSDKEIVSKKTEQSHGNISELMDSLALSEDSGEYGLKTSVDRRSSNFSNSTAYSSLIGLHFLESTRNNPSK